MNINILKTTHVQSLNPDVRNKFLLQNRIIKFQRQLQYQFDEKNYYPKKALAELKRLKQMLKYYLKNYLIIHNSKLQKIKKELNQLPTQKIHWESTTNLEYIVKKPKISLVKRTMLDNLENTSLIARKSQHIWRIVNELELAIHNNLYVIFNTLTINPLYYHTVCNTQSTCFKKYKSLWDNIAGPENHTYYAVIEIGSLGRLHFHVLHILKSIPQKWKTDINYAKPQPSNRIINQARTFWDYGFSTPIAVRFSAFDAWGKLHWRWPVKQNESGFSEAIPESNSKKMAYYIAKYITKSLINKEPKPWKTKLKQGFGLSIIQQSLPQMTTQQLQNLLIAAPMKRLQIHMSMIPPFFLTRLATKLILERLKSDNLTTQLMTLKAQDSIMKQLKSLTQQTPLYKLQKCGPIQIPTLKNTAISDLQEIINRETLKQTGYIYTQQIHTIRGATRNVQQSLA
nr:MAG: replication initiation protein [Microvirus sp.]